MAATMTKMRGASSLLVCSRSWIGSGWFPSRSLSHTVPSHGSPSPPSDSYLTETTGAPGTLDYRIFVKTSEGTRISPWHDIPLRPVSNPAIVHFVNEIPRLTKAKFEISHNEKFNAIKQDTKKGALRFLKHGGGVLHNYGGIPQTWEDPKELVSDKKGQRFRGDDDPLDALDIGATPAEVGQVLQLKVLGVLGLIDEGECDWKVIGINVADPMAKDLNDITDVSQEVIDKIREWYRVYKVVDGKEPNQYLDDGEAKNQKFALKVIEDAHHSWKKFIKATERS